MEVLGGRQVSSGLAGSADCWEGAADPSLLCKEWSALLVQCCWAFPHSWARASVFKLAVSNIAKSKASLLLEKQRLSISKYFHWFSPGLRVVQTWRRETPLPGSYASRGSVNHRRTPYLLMRPGWWMARRWASASEGQSMVWATELVLVFPSTSLLRGSEFPTGTPWKGSSKQRPMISGASKHQSPSSSWMTTLPLVPRSPRAAGLCCLLFTASCLSHLWSCSVFTVKLFIQVPYSLSGFAEGAKVSKQKTRAGEKQPLAATLVHGLLQSGCSRWAGS